ncbi:MAG TPA: hypothetical protein VI248_04275 [Kineosporiaceae bacterium]
MTTPGINRRDDGGQADGPAAMDLFASGGQPGSVDLWSLPPDRVSATADDRLLAAWIGALAQSERDEPPAGPALPLGSEENEAEDDVSRLPARSGRRASRSRQDRRPVIVIILLVVVGALIGAVALALLGGMWSDQVEVRRVRGNSADGTSADAPDGRVVVPGKSADCPLMLVRPRDSGTTTDVPGACFAVG